MFSYIPFPESAIKDLDLRPLACLKYGFEPLGSKDVCLVIFVYFQIEISSSG
jgi:hypothetical protein